MSQTDHVNNDVKTCLKVFPVLALLILVTVAVHQSNLPYKYQLFIEIVKAFIAVGYFLHLIANKREINTTWILTIVFVMALLFLPIANGLNHIHGSTDMSKQVQADQISSQPEHSESTPENVH